MPVLSSRYRHVPEKHTQENKNAEPKCRRQGGASLIQSKLRMEPWRDSLAGSRTCFEAMRPNLELAFPNRAPARSVDPSSHHRLSVLRTSGPSSAKTISAMTVGYRLTTTLPLSGLRYSVVRESRSRQQCLRGHSSWRAVRAGLAFPASGTCREQPKGRRMAKANRRGHRFVAF